MRFQRAAATLACALALTLSACGDSGTAPNFQSIAGTYVATQFQTTTGGVTTNQLAGGATVTLVLGVDGSTTGRLFIPALLDAPLTGTWQLVNQTDIDLDSTNDTFLRDMVLRIAGNTLVGDQTFSSTRVQLVLTKQ